MKRGLRRRLIITAVLLLIAFAGIVVRSITNALSHLTPYGELAPALMPTAEYLERNPIRRPVFISGADSRPNNRNEMCLGMVINTISALNGRATVDARVTVDLYAGHTVAIDGYTALGSLLGSVTHQGACFDVSNLSAGLHLASVELTTRDGIEHTYTWAFRIEPESDS